MAGRTCTVCTHPDRAEIDRKLAWNLASERSIAKQHGLNDTSVHRHSGRHLDRQLIAQAQATLAERSKGLVARIDRMAAAAESILADGIHRKSAGIILAAIAQLRPSLELYGKATGELRERIDITVQAAPPPQEEIAERAIRFLEDRGYRVLSPSQAIDPGKIKDASWDSGGAPLLAQHGISNGTPTTLLAEVPSAELVKATVDRDSGGSGGVPVSEQGVR